MTNNLSKILEALGVLKGADPKVLDSITGDLSLEKAAEKLRPHEHVADHWEEGHTNLSATKEEIKTGPGQAATGGNAERQIGEYSNTAPQHGLVLTSEALARMLKPIAASSKANSEAILLLIDHGRNVVKSVDEVIAMMGKGKSRSSIKAAKKAGEDEEEDDEEEDEEESEVVEINASRKAQKLVAKASTKVRALKAKKAEMEDMEGDERKACKAEIKLLKADVTKLLSDALTFAYAAGNADLKKAIRKAASKADINVVQEEEEDEEEEEEEDAEKARKAKAAAKAAADAVAAAEKAKTNDHGNQADRMDGKNGNQAAASKSDGIAADDLSAMKTRIDAALNGMDVLRGSVNQMLDVVAGKSSVSTLAPDITKALSSEGSDAALLQRIRELEDAGEMERENAGAARDIVSKLSAVRKGVLDKSILTDRLSRAPTAVRQLFEGAIAA